MIYEYKVVNINVAFSLGSGCQKKIQAKCDELGKQGWELVNFQCYDLSTKFMLVFKKAKEY